MTVQVFFFFFQIIYFYLPLFSCCNYNNEKALDFFFKKKNYKLVHINTVKKKKETIQKEAPKQSWFFNIVK